MSGSVGVYMKAWNHPMIKMRAAKFLLEIISHKGVGGNG